MITFAKLGNPAERVAYHLVERGYWVGKGAHTLLGPRVHRKIQPEHFRAVLEGRHPLDSTVDLLGHRRRDRVACLHVSLTTSKSVSLAALGQVPEVDDTAVRDAHRCAVGEVWRQVARLARGRPLARERPDGPRVHLVGAVYEHTRSRMDPPDQGTHLHTHLYIANLAQSVDTGRWVAIEKGSVAEQKRWLEAVYANALVVELTARGVPVGRATGHRLPELMCVTDEEIETASRAKRVIQKYAEEHRGLSPEIFRKRKLNLRAAKTTPEPQLLGPFMRHPQAVAGMVTVAPALRRAVDRLADQVGCSLTAETAGPAALLWQAYRLVRTRVSRLVPWAMHADYLCETLREFSGFAHVGTWLDAIRAANPRPTSRTLMAAWDVAHQLRVHQDIAAESLRLAELAVRQGAAPLEAEVGLQRELTNATATFPVRPVVGSQATPDRLPVTPLVSSDPAPTSEPYRLSKPQIERDIPTEATRQTPASGNPGKLSGRESAAARPPDRLSSRVTPPEKPPGQGAAQRR